jgi:hypothetical protein
MKLKIEWTGFGLVVRIGAGDRESANKSWLVARVRDTSRISDNPVATAAALHREIAVPSEFFRQNGGEANAKLLLVNAFATVDDSVDTAMGGRGPTEGAPDKGGGARKPEGTSSAFEISTRPRLSPMTRTGVRRLGPLQLSPQ